MDSGAPVGPPSPDNQTPPLAGGADPPAPLAFSDLSTIGPIAKAIGRSPETVRQWAKRKTITRRGFNQRGEALYSLAEVKTYAATYVSDGGHGGRRTGAGRRGRAGGRDGGEPRSGPSGSSGQVAKWRSGEVATKPSADGAAVPRDQPVQRDGVSREDQDAARARWQALRTQLTSDDHDLEQMLATGFLTAADLDLYQGFLKAQQLRLQVAEKNGRLVDVNRVRAEVGAQFKSVRETLDQLPGLLVPRLAAALGLDVAQTARVREIVTDQILHTRREIARAQLGPQPGAQHGNQATGQAQEVPA